MLTWKRLFDTEMPDSLGLQRIIRRPLVGHGVYMLMYSGGEKHRLGTLRSYIFELVLVQVCSVGNCASACAGTCAGTFACTCDGTSAVSCACTCKSKLISFTQNAKPNPNKTKPNIILSPSNTYKCNRCISEYGGGCGWGKVGGAGWW